MWDLCCRVPCQNIRCRAKVALNLSRRHWSARDTLPHLVQQWKRIPNLSLVCPPLIRILYRASFFPFGKVTEFCFQIIGRTASRKYWSVTDKVCVSLPHFTRSLKFFFLCCTIESSDTTCGCSFVGIDVGSETPRTTSGVTLYRLVRNLRGGRRVQKYIKR